MNEPLAGTLVLLAVSVTAKVVPAFVPVPERWLAPLERTVPVVVLLNLAVYSLADEVRAAPLPGAAGAVALIVTAWLTPLPLIGKVLAACAVYAAIAALP